MAKESLQSKLDRVRKPRVQIKYEVEIGDAIELKELPFVVGVLADLSGQPQEKLPKLKDRPFTEIDRDNFNEVLKRAKPRLAFRVDNRLSDDDSSLGLELKFESMDDFGPEKVAAQVEPIRKLVQARDRLHQLSLKINANDHLEDLLQDVLDNTDALRGLSAAATRAATPSGEED